MPGIYMSGLMDLTAETSFTIYFFLEQNLAWFASESLLISVLVPSPSTSTTLPQKHPLCCIQSGALSPLEGKRYLLSPP